MKIKKNSLSYFLLDAIEKASSEGIFEGFSYSSQMKYFLDLPHLKPGTKKHALASAIRRIKEKGLIEEEKNHDGKIVFKLTNLGKDFIGKEEKWDGKYRIVIWDIPEKKRRLRDLFRRKLKDWDFINLQKSVWVSKRNVTQKLRDLINELKMEDWVVIIESDDSSIGTVFFHDRGDL